MERGRFAVRVRGDGGTVVVWPCFTRGFSFLGKIESEIGRVPRGLRTRKGSVMAGGERAGTFIRQSNYSFPVVRYYFKYASEKGGNTDLC